MDAGVGILASTESELPKEMEDKVRALIAIHGPWKLVKESRGRHLYLPCPDCLEKLGRKELTDQHLAINMDRYFMTGKVYANRVGTMNADRSGMCMRTGTPFSVSELLRMKSLEERGVPDVKVGVDIRVTPRHLVPDGKGNMIPVEPGDAFPVVGLSERHPSAVYLKDRNYDLEMLARQFRLAYCWKETPEDPVVKRFYRRMPDGWKNTPQGRIIFYADMQGVQRAWQGRIIDRIVDDGHYYWHPYKQAWVLVRTKSGSDWDLVPAYKNDENYRWEPAKYRIANGAARNETLMGLDAALEFNKNRGESESFCVLCEGPLDAARFPGPGIALLGKHISPEQIEMITRYFKHVIWIGDNDKVGREATAKARVKLAGKVRGRLEVIQLPDKGLRFDDKFGSIKDPGDLHPFLARELIADYY